MLERNQKRVVESKPATPHERLVGWRAIAKYLGQTLAVAQRWHESGMPVQHKGRHVSAVPEELTRWVGMEAGTTKSVHISDDQEDLLADLKEGLSFVRKAKNSRK